MKKPQGDMLRDHSVALVCLLNLMTKLGVVGGLTDDQMIDWLVRLAFPIPLAVVPLINLYPPDISLDDKLSKLKRASADFMVLLIALRLSRPLDDWEEDLRCYVNRILGKR